MNNTIRELMERKSVRVYEPRPIDREEEKLILEAAAAAPTAGNQQLYTILKITDPEIKTKLADSCDHQPFIASAGLVLIFLADCRKWLEAYREAGVDARTPGAGDLLLAVEDAVIAAQNAVCAAESLGIGSCYIGDIMENIEFHRELLKLPEYVYPAAMLVFGYPTEQQKTRKKPSRVEMQYIVHENSYRLQTGEELRTMFSPRCGESGFDEWIQRFYNRKYNSGFCAEMNRSMDLYLRDYRQPEDVRNE